jgi:hypothetical protein
VQRSMLSGSNSEFWVLRPAPVLRFWKSGLPRDRKTGAGLKTQN